MDFLKTETGCNGRRVGLVNSMWDSILLCERLRIPFMRISHRVLLDHTIEAHGASGGGGRVDVEEASRTHTRGLEKRNQED